MDLSGCVHCGLCLTSCPTYQVTGRESESPRGRVLLVARARQAVAEGHRVEAAVWEPLDDCLECQACEAVCPAHVPVGHAVEELRQTLGTAPAPPVLGTALLGSAGGIRRFRRWAGSARAAGLYRAGRWARRLPGSWGALGDVAAGLPPRPGRSEADTAAGAAMPDGNGPHVVFFAGCVMEGVYPDTNRRTVALLRWLGYRVTAVREAACCGALARHHGEAETARDWARGAIARLEALGGDVWVTNAAGCGAAFKEYDRWLADDPAWAERAAGFRRRVRDVVEVVPVSSLPPGLLRDAPPVTVHDACHLVHAQGLRDPVRAVLGRLGQRLEEMPEADVCCGSAGVYNLLHRDMARALGARKAGHVPPGVQRVVTANPGCMLQIQASLRAAGRAVDVVHWVDLVWPAVAGTARSAGHGP